MPKSSFSKKSATKDGLQDRCKSCFSEYNKRRYAADRERFKNQIKEYRQNNPGAVLETRVKMCEKNPTQKNAHMVIDAAINAGVVERPDHCYGCGCANSEHRIEAHHHDYSKPLEVIWLCTPCHRRMDKQRQNQEAMRL